MQLDDTISKDKYLEQDKNMEVVSIKIDDLNSLLSYDYKIYDSVNILFTGKITSTTKAVEKLGLKNVIKSDEVMTLKLLENVKILKIYDEYKKEVSESKGKKLIYIVCRVSKNMSVVINNLKEYGYFMISTSR